MNNSNPDIEFSIVIPCLNEAKTIVTVINKALSSFQRLNIQGEIIVSDNGSDDGSQELAANAGAVLVAVEEQGYGAALIGGINAASGKYVIMGDADDSYDFGKIDEFVEELRAGYDLVMGTRLKGTILPGAMPWLHQYFGNPFLTWLGNVLLGANVSDYHCGLRGFNRERMKTLNLHTSGMEFASEMVAKSALNNFTIAEVPIVYHPDGRGRAPHLRTWRDGWRHLKFLLIMSAFRVFFTPGIILTVTGLISFILFGFKAESMSESQAVVSAVLIVLGIQVINIGVMTRIFSIKVKLLPSNPTWDRLIDIGGFDTGFIMSMVITLGSLATIILTWNNFNPVLAIVSFVLLTLAVQIMSTSFAISMLKVHSRFE